MILLQRPAASSVTMHILYILHTHILFILHINFQFPYWIFLVSFQSILVWDHDHNIFSYFNVEQKVEMFQTNCPQTENYCLHETADRAQTNKIIGLFAINSEKTSLWEEHWYLNIKWMRESCSSCRCYKRKIHFKCFFLVLNSHQRLS